MKYLIIKNKNQEKIIINYLIKVDSLPQIQRRLNVFSADDKFQIEILNNKVSYRQKNRSKAIFVENKNLKYFFKSFDNSKDYYINNISFLKFKNCSILFNTYHGTIISTENEQLCQILEKKFKLIRYDNINDHKLIVNPEPEHLFDEIGVLNSKIRNYGLKTGLDIRSISTSLKVRLSNISNDYSYLDNYYEKIMGHQLLSTNSHQKKDCSIMNMSIIIPVYNQDVTYTLLSIQGQNLSRDNKKKLQVIVVNDGSKNNVIDEINKIKNKLDFELQIISFEENMGLSNARNVGFAISKYNQVLFLDSDIVLSKNYIYDMNIRTQLIPNAIFTCMRKNIDRSSNILKERLLLSGIDSSTDFDDSRVITKGKEYHIGGDKAYLNEEISILDDTDYFKELSFGSQIDIYNIATVVSGHNIALNKALINFSEPFSSKFKGWGMENAYFSAKLISKGCYVIPVLSSCVYHIKHPPRSGSIEQKNKEAHDNYIMYEKLLNQPWKW